MPDIDPAEIARDLVKATANLERHIAAEAQKRATKLGVQYAKAAQEQVDAAQADARRWKECNDELRRQMKPLERYAAGHFVLRNRLGEIIRIAKERGEPVPPEVLQQVVTAARDAEHAVAEQQKKTAATDA